MTSSHDDQDTGGVLHTCEAGMPLAGSPTTTPWLEYLADDVTTIEGSLLDGAALGPDAVRKSRAPSAQCMTTSEDVTKRVAEWWVESPCGRIRRGSSVAVGRAVSVRLISSAAR